MIFDGFLLLNQKAVPLCPVHKQRLEHRSGKFGKFWGCPCFPNCDVVGDKTESGSWVLSNQDTRQARIAAHEAFDRIWQSGIMKRPKAYGILAEMLGIEREDCHMKNFDKDTCEKVIALAPLIANWPKTVYPTIEP